MPSNNPPPGLMLRALFQSGPALLGIVGTAAFFILWEVVARLEFVNPALLPPPSRVVAAAYELVVSGELMRHLAASIWRALLGFLFGSVTGIAVGIATARMPVFRHMSDPLLQMFRAIPSIAFVPLAIFWFGIGETSKVFLIAWGVFFPIWVNTFLGVRDCNPLLMRAASTLGAGRLQMLWSVILPGALPLILAGLRISLAVALVLLVAAELAGATAGVGYFIQISAQVFRVDQMFVGLLTLGLLGFCADLLFVTAVQLLFPWYGAESRAARR
ncbi:ABC transporter permease [Pseudaminobacter sp. NGMCC 1.201702]|uniref:ABC transporter permease n=1 Tax=Pseudaminobacter sp. NGMCC 1.201702 TaxID=3391825 RepID=UPI0039EF6300